MNRLNCEAYLIGNKLEPITEQANELTRNIDLAESGEQILSHLSRTDLEIFNGWQIEPNLKTDGLKSDSIILNKCAKLARLVQANLSNLAIILTGCGTSGRIGYLYSQRINEYFNKSDLADYILAGGEYALVNSVESIEDKPDLGVQELRVKLAKYSSKLIIFIGITCGLSAPFVAGQLDYLLSNRETNILATCLIGFNPVEMARNTVHINSNKETFLDLIKRMQLIENEQPEKFFILNPLIGPEPITGSSRMKGGTATKLILDLILTQATTTNLNPNEVLSYFESAHELVYSRETQIELGALIDSSGECLRKSGSINYLSRSERLGLLCCVDASECVPTYGARREDIRGFVSSSRWLSFSLNCPETKADFIVANSKQFNVFNTLFLVIDHDEINLGDLVPQAKVVYLSKLRISQRLEERLETIQARVNKFLRDSVEEYVLKLVVNAISTGAHVLVGKVYENLMVDVRVSNFKLYKRAIKIIHHLTRLDERECEINLLKSIYERDQLDGVNQSDIDQHLSLATSKDLIVPRALVISLGQLTFNQASLLLNKSSVRNCLKNLKK